MRLELKFGAGSMVVEVRNESGGHRAWIDGRPIEFEPARLPGSHYSIRTGTRVYDFHTAVSGTSILVSGREGRYSFQVSDPRSLASLDLAEGEETGLQRLCAEMPGKVIRVLAKPGETVSIHQPLLVLEAMKMQNEIRAPKNGIVVEVGVEEGKAVNSGDFLISIDGVRP